MLLGTVLISHYLCLNKATFYLVFTNFCRPDELSSRSGDHRLCRGGSTRLTTPEASFFRRAEHRDETRQPHNQQNVMPLRLAVLLLPSVEGDISRGARRLPWLGKGFLLASAFFEGPASLSPQPCRGMPAYAYSTRLLDK